jgi:FkbM family methyltransferase
MLKTSIFAQKLFNLMLRPGNRASLPSKATDAFLRLIRHAAVSLLNDPCVTYQLDGSVLSIPLSHELPFIRARYPHYSTNIARIASALKTKYPNLTMVDIGANVGDTVAIVRRLSYFPILCIDGDPNFFSLLQANSKSWNGIFLDNSFVGETTSSMAGRVEIAGGTGHLVPDFSSSSMIETRRLSTILAEFPDFAAPTLIKIDTDGFDTRIIKCENLLLHELKPVVFFEYDPYFFGKNDDDGFSVFSRLAAAGYVSALFFENTGEFLIRADLDDVQLLEDLHHFYTGRNGKRYCDICVFTAEDIDVLEQVRVAELSCPLSTQ